MTKEKALEIYMGSFKDAKQTHFEFIWGVIHSTNKEQDYRIFVDDFNSILERNFKYADVKAQRQFKSLRKAGYTPDDDLKVFKALKDDSFHMESDYKYCTPEYISRMNIYEKYRNQYKEEIKLNFKQAIGNPYK